jgi:hypothetical protein
MFHLMKKDWLIYTQTTYTLNNAHLVVLLINQFKKENSSINNEY